MFSFYIFLLCFGARVGEFSFRIETRYLRDFVTVMRKGWLWIMSWQMRTMGMQCDACWWWGEKLEGSGHSKIWNRPLNSSKSGFAFIPSPTPPHLSNALETFLFFNKHASKFIRFTNLRGLYMTTIASQPWDDLWLWAYKCLIFNCNLLMSTEMIDTSRNWCTTPWRIYRIPRVKEFPPSRSVGSMSCDIKLLLAQDVNSRRRRR